MPPRRSQIDCSPPPPPLTHGRLFGDFSAAERELRAALALANKIDSPYWIRSVAGMLVSALVAGGSLNGASAVLGEHFVDGIPMDTIAGRILWVAAADLALAKGDPSHVLEITDRLVKAVPGGANGRLPRMDLLRGEALAALGHYTEAEQALDAAREAATWCGARPLHWRILAARGRLDAARGREEDAERVVAQAHAVISELAVAVPDEALQAPFLARAARETHRRPTA